MSKIGWIKFEKATLFMRNPMGKYFLYLAKSHEKLHQNNQIPEGEEQKLKPRGKKLKQFNELFSGHNQLISPSNYLSLNGFKLTFLIILFPHKALKAF